MIKTEVVGVEDKVENTNAAENKERMWTMEEIEYLIENYRIKPLKQLASELNRSLASIQAKYKRVMKFTNENPKWNKLKSGVEVRKKLEKQGRVFSKDEELFACPVCEKLYKNFSNLKRHYVRTHYGEGVCHVCNAKYNRLILHFAKQGYDVKNEKIVDIEHLVLFGLVLRKYSTADKTRKLALDVAYNFCSIWGDLDEFGDECGKFG